MTGDSVIPNAPADDGAIDQALAGLDAAVADWAAAMGEAQAALSVVDESPERVPGRARGWLPEEIATDPRFADPTPMFGDEPLPADEFVEPPQAAATPVEAPECGEVVKPFVDRGARPETRSTAAAADLSQVDETLSEEDADALLMAALDPATAYAIRVRRRLTDRKLSVAELMDGLWPSDESSRAEQAKKRKKWWKRRKSGR